MGSYSRPTIDAATAMLSQIGLSIEHGAGDDYHSFEKDRAALWAKSLEPPPGTLATWLADVDARMGRGMVTMQQVPPITIGISSPPPSRATSSLAIVKPLSRRLPRARMAMSLSSTVSCQASCPAAKDTAIRPPRPGGNA